MRRKLSLKDRVTDDLTVSFADAHIVKVGKIFRSVCLAPKIHRRKLRVSAYENSVLRSLAVICNALFAAADFLKISVKPFCRSNSDVILAIDGSFSRRGSKGNCACCPVNGKVRSLGLVLPVSVFVKNLRLDLSFGEPRERKLKIFDCGVSLRNEKAVREAVR